MKKSKKIHQLTEAEFAELKAGANEALAHAQGRKVTLRTRSFSRAQRPKVFTPARIRSIRLRLNMSQPVFAELLYVTKGTAAKWEQGSRKPSGSALRLLEIAEKRPRMLVEALESSGSVYLATRLRLRCDWQIAPSKYD